MHFQVKPMQERAAPKKRFIERTNRYGFRNGKILSRAW